jgi:hypothetical protein
VDETAAARSLAQRQVERDRDTGQRRVSHCALCEPLDGIISSPYSLFTTLVACAVRVRMCVVRACVYRNKYVRRVTTIHPSLQPLPRALDETQDTDGVSLPILASTLKP